MGVKEKEVDEGWGVGKLHPCTCTTVYNSQNDVLIKLNRI